MVFTSRKIGKLLCMDFKAMKRIEDVVSQKRININNEPTDFLWLFAGFGYSSYHSQMVDSYEHPF